MKTSENPDIPEFVTMNPLGLVADTPSPSFIEIDSKRALLFAVNEVDRFDGKASGSVSAFAIDRASGKLAPLGQRPSMGTRPCHLALDRDRKHLLVANGGSGSVALLPVAADGKLGPATDVRQHTGKSVHPRQQGPHPQGVGFQSRQPLRLRLRPGPGQGDGLSIRRRRGQVAAPPAGVAPLKPGAGPRHLVFRPDGKFAYVVNELDSTVTGFAYDPAAGSLKPVQTLSTLPGYYDGPNRACEIAIHPSGKYLLVSNCGHNSVVLFDIDAAGGALTYVEDQSTYGTMPVHFGMDTEGKHFAVANRDSGNLLILRAPGERPGQARRQRSEGPVTAVRGVSGGEAEPSPATSDSPPAATAPEPASRSRPRCSPRTRQCWRAGWWRGAGSIREPPPPPVEPPLPLEPLPPVPVDPPAYRWNRRCRSNRCHPNRWRRRWRSNRRWRTAARAGGTTTAARAAGAGGSTGAGCAAAATRAATATGVGRGAAVARLGAAAAVDGRGGGAHRRGVGPAGGTTVITTRILVGT